MTCTGESCNQGRAVCAEGCELTTWEWVAELIISITTLFACAAGFGLVAGITYALICLARDFKFL
jgi:hypothetical protein